MPDYRNCKMFETYVQTKTSDTKVRCEALILRDIEKLKELKNRILKHQP
jgi:hypothetical protein